jgi:MFS family permease
VLRRIAPSALLPALIYEFGNGAIAPVLALVAIGEGASTAIAGLMLSLSGIGRILGDVPAAWLANKLGDRRAMMVAAALTALALGLNWAIPELWAMTVAQLIIGACNATFYLARQTYVSAVVRVDLRARALSTLAGAHRVGLFLGPFIAAGAIGLWGARAAFGVAIAATLCVGVLLLTVPDEEEATDRPRAEDRSKVSAMYTAHKDLFWTLGVAVLLVGAVRGARQTVLPLWAGHIGMSAAETSLIFGVANAVDMSLFYPAGHVMDRFGRLAVAVPSMLLLGAGMMLLPLSHGIVLLGVSAIVMSFGNGIGSGIMMTIGSDVAPPGDRTTFLSLWRLLSDSGNALGPLVPALIAGFAPLGLGIAVTGVMGLGAAGGLARWLPRYSTYATVRMAREHQHRLAAADSAMPAP